jgi:PIN domain nuclease of toxin-antitoxin system
VRVLLDTPVFIWLVARPARLSKEALRVLKKPDTVREISTLSLTEIAVKVSLGKLDLTKEQVRRKIADLEIEVLPYGAAHAYAYFDLPLHHYDPFDRQLIAQAIGEDIPILTPDEIFVKYPVQVIW